jgi:hypothetical protein
LSQTPLYVKVGIVAALTVMILAAAPTVLNLQHQSIAQEQQQPQQQQPNGISFQIDNVTFSD